MPRPTRLEILEYAQEGLRTLIGIGTGYENEDVLDEYAEHQEWLDKEVARVEEKNHA